SFDTRAFELRFHSEHLDRAGSYIVALGSEPVAVVLVARRGWTSHISGLAVAPAWRRRGIARLVLDRVLEDARARDARRVLLEVPENNIPTVRLYESTGFVTRRRLVGFIRTPSSTSSRNTPAVIEVDLSTVARVAA